METRIAELERVVRRWRFVTFGALGVAICAVVVAALPWVTGDVRSTRFTLINDRGDEVGGLGFDAQDEPRLALKLRRNNGTVLVGALAEDIAGLGITSGTSTATLATDSGGYPALSLHASGATASVAVSRDMQPTLFMKAGPANLLATSSAIRIREPSGNVVLLPGSLGIAEPRKPAKP